MQNPSTETQIALLIAAQVTMKSDLADATKAIAAIQEERTRALTWGIVTLGTAVIGMAAWIFNTISTAVGYIK